MKRSCIISMAAASALFATQTAQAEAAPHTVFRSPAPVALTQADVDKLQVDAATAEKIESYKRAGYKVYALNADQLDNNKAGASSTTWVVIGVVVLVVVVAAAAGGGGGGGSGGGGY